MGTVQATSSRQWVSRLLRAGLLTVLAGLAVLAWTASFGGSRTADSREPVRDEPVPFFTSPEPAGNPQKLHLLVDDGKVVGWVGGTGVVPQWVEVRVGDKAEKVELRKDGTFTWSYQVDRPTEAGFEFRHCCMHYPHLRRAVTLLPRPQREPTAFFVTDRSLYRPGQPLYFAGFLRKLDERGDFTPVANETVEVRITSEKTKTVAGKVRLTSDDIGRIAGSYNFVDADPRDDYILSIPRYRGTARLTHAEYRKSKIKLRIAGALEESMLRLRFEAVDFLDQPIGGSKVQFTAQVVRQPAREQPRALKAEEFVYHDAAALELPALETLSEEERLLWEAGERPLPSPGSWGPAVINQFNGEVALAGKEPGEHAIELPKEWLDDRHAVIVQGVLIDENGREQRATHSIALGQKQSVPPKRLQVSLPKRVYEVDEKVPVTARLVGATGKKLKGSSTLVAMHLTTAPPEVHLGGRLHHLLDLGGYATPNGGFHRDIFNAPNGAAPRGRLRGRLDVPAWPASGPGQDLGHMLADAVPFKGSEATLKLSEPGTYTLVVISHLADGTRLREEVSCVVRPRGELPGLVLNLDRTDYRSSDTLAGTIHSRFAGAHVLLSLRDSSGTRLAKPLKLDGSMLRFQQPLPGDLRYGCTVEVQYLDENDQLHLASKFIRVNPVHRQIDITTTMKEVCAPGDKVKIDIAVNREESVDLVVSVYDQSLLGIVPDCSVDPRHFYLADETVSQAREVLRRKLGGVTVDELLKRARRMVEQQIRLPGGMDGPALDRLVGRCRANCIGSGDVIALLGLAGVESRLLPSRSNGNWCYQHPENRQGEQRLIDILQATRENWRLATQMWGDLLVLAEMHTIHANGKQHWQAWTQFGFDRADYRARGDAHHSMSANASFSHAPAPAAPVPLLGASADQGSVLVRRDFSDSAFWEAGVRTGKDGKTSVEFKLPDSLTNWQVVVTAVTKDLHVGRHTARFRTFKPIMVWPMLPRVFAQGDRAVIYASVHNRTGERQTVRVRLKVDNGAVLSREEEAVVVEPRSSMPVYWTFQPKDAGFTQILMTAECQAGSDASLKRLPVAAVTAEQALTLSGYCKDAAVLRVPDGANLTTASLEVTFSPSLAADMADTLTYLVEYPHGCVEQTMSKFLPAIKVAQVLRQFQINHPELEKKLPGCVEGGIKRLLELQRSDGGWAWHGGGQTHEMMTPYALYGLLQAEKAGYAIPREDAIQKGLARLKQFIDAMGEGQAADRIYCMYVYAHREDIADDWWKFLADQLEKKRLSDYALALALEMAVQKRRGGLADKLAAALRDRAQKTKDQVCWQTAGFSRWGDDRHEVTAAAMKALVAYDHDHRIIPEVLAYFAATKRGNRWNSTKDTAMIVYAICDYLAKQDYSRIDKHVATFEVNGRNTTRVSFEDGLTAKMAIPGRHLKAGENRITFVSSSPGVMYRAVLRYAQAGAQISPLERGIRVTRRFYVLNAQGQAVRELHAGDSVPRGAYLQSEVTAYHMQGQSMRYVLVEDPRPSCCEVQPADDRRFPQECTPYALREEKETLLAYHHEQTPAIITDRCVLHAELAGDYVVPPAVVELMYQTETRGHSGTFRFKVVEQ